MTDYHHSNKSSNILHKIYGNNMKFYIKLTRDFLLEKLIQRIKNPILNRSNQSHTDRVRVSINDTTFPILHYICRFRLPLPREKSFLIACDCCDSIQDWKINFQWPRYKINRLEVVASSTCALRTKTFFFLWFISRLEN